MSICLTGINTKAIPTCIGSLTIGSVGSHDIPLMVYIQDVTTGLVSGQAIIAIGGTIIVDLTQFDFAQRHSYEAWVTLQNDSPQNKIDITIGATTSKTVILNFVDVDENGTPFSLPSLTLEEA